MRRPSPKSSLESPAAPPPPTAAFHAGTVALLGRPNVGKSTLLNALLGQRIAITSHHPQTTRDRIAGIVSQDGAQLVFLDTPGFHTATNRLGERMNELARRASEECDVAIFMTDVDAKPSGVRPADEKILATIPAGKPTLVVLNKVDKVHPKELLFPVLEAYAKLRDVAAIVPVSALKGNGVDRILAEVAKLLPEGEALYDAEEISDKPLRFFVAEFVREQILKRTRQEVPHGVAVTVESFEDGPKQTRVAVTVHVAKESHKAIIIGDGGTMLRDIGTAARKRAEELIGQKVHLETWVKANLKWFDDPRQLADLGYEDGAEAKRPKKRASKTKSAMNAKSAKSAKSASKAVPPAATSRPVR